MSGQTVTVGYATSDGTATTTDSDYVATSGTLSFAPGVTTQAVIVKEILDFITNGKIQVESELGKGTLFIVRLPCL